MAISFIASHVQSRLALFAPLLPIAADLMATAVFKRMTTDGKAQVAGVASGLGVLYFWGKQTSTAMRLTGAALYLTYKVVANTRFSTSQQNFTAAMQAVDRRWRTLQSSFVCVSDKELDFKDSGFDSQITALTEELTSQTDPIQANWEKPLFLTQTYEIMKGCQNILFEIHTNLELQTINLRSNHEARLKKMDELLKDEEKRVFDAAFSLLNTIYRMVRCKGYVISLPKISNYPGRNFSCFIMSPNIPEEYCHLFITAAHGQQCVLNTFFNATQDKLASLLERVYPNSPLNAQDKLLTPGDYMNMNSTNPFRINIKRV